MTRPWQLMHADAHAAPRVSVIPRMYLGRARGILSAMGMPGFDLTDQSGDADSTRDAPHTRQRHSELLTALTSPTTCKHGAHTIRCSATRRSRRMPTSLGDSQIYMHGTRQEVGKAMLQGAHLSTLHRATGTHTCFCACSTPIF